MADRTEALAAGGPGTPARPLTLPREQISRRLLVDRLARRLVGLGGGAIIASILAILLVIAAEVFPLFKAPTATPVTTVPAGTGGPPLRAGVDEYREVAYVVTRAGLQFVSLKEERLLPTPPLPGLGSASVVSASTPRGGQLALGLSDGRVLPVEILFTVSFPAGGRRVDPELGAAEPLTADPNGRPVRLVAQVTAPSGPMTAAVVGPKDLILVLVTERKALIGPATREEARRSFALPVEGEITALALDGRGEDLFVGTSAGQIARLDLRDPSEPGVAEVLLAVGRAGVGVTALGFLIGDRTLVVGDAAGGVSSWQILPDDGGRRRLRKIHDFTPHGGPVVAFASSRRDKGFLTGDGSGTVHLHYGTTGATLLTARVEADQLRAITFAPKADGFVAADAAGRLAHWGLHNPHPEVTWRSLFAKIWYEGYPEPDHVWQSTGGTDDFEAKLSLTPLIFGTLKGTLYALLFAIPVALLGALYASQFMHPTLKGIVKPTVEIMAALPSVVLGFVAGLWLAPMVEKVVPGLFLLPWVLAVLILLALALWRLAPVTFRRRVRAGTEVFLLVPVILVGAWLAFSLGGLVESALLAGDYRGWLLRTLGLTYDQRNSLVVGFAMGFAVIPIIFTIAEDALSNVPPHLVAGSLALGATRWQTALRMVLPTASPGIFSAIMIGLGRAVGETMIVLMATGNTPVMDWSIFNGFRALSANIAVELPEAPEGGTLYRVLFLAAFLLFVMTFLVNTVAELVRLRLRRRYQAL
ncbi:MAG TPA: ABC transporter permease subunit [Candidatus Methylomirabilis sp.]|jgi:phosphate transport system permease protein|nr:ABC transporter permease subunit [Candidatus Methylomirabilis sp.]